MFTEDLAPFFTDFAEDVVVDGVTVPAIFDNGFIDAGALGVAGTEPRLRVQTSVLPAVAVGQTAVVRGVNYVVRGIEPDGTGTTVLRLERS